MSEVTVCVHLAADTGVVGDVAAERVSRRGWADVYLSGESVPTRWSSVETAHCACDIASRYGLDNTERGRLRASDIAYADECGDPRWIVTFTA